MEEPASSWLGGEEGSFPSSTNVPSSDVSDMDEEPEVLRSWCAYGFWPS